MEIWNLLNENNINIYFNELAEKVRTGEYKDFKYAVLKEIIKKKETMLKELGSDILNEKDKAVFQKLEEKLSELKFDNLKTNLKHEVKNVDKIRRIGLLNKFMDDAEKLIISDNDIETLKEEIEKAYSYKELQQEKAKVENEITQRNIRLSEINDEIRSLDDYEKHLATDDYSSEVTKLKTEIENLKFWQVELEKYDSKEKVEEKRNQLIHKLQDIKIENARNLNENKNKLEKEKIENDSKIENLAEEQENLKSELEKLESKLKEKSEEKEEILNQIKSIFQSIMSELDDNFTLNNNYDLNVLINDPRINKLKGEIQELNFQKGKIEEIQMKNINSQIHSIKSENSRMEEELSKAEKQVQKINPNGDNLKNYNNTLDEIKEKDSLSLLDGERLRTINDIVRNCAYYTTEEKKEIFGKIDDIYTKHKEEFKISVKSNIDFDKEKNSNVVIRKTTSILAKGSLKIIEGMSSIYNKASNLIETRSQKRKEKRNRKYLEKAKKNLSKYIENEGKTQEIENALNDINNTYFNSNPEEEEFYDAENKGHAM